MKRFNYIKAFNSPFKRPKLKWYFGKIAIGTPYFYPRRWVKPTQQMLIDNAKKEIEERKRWNESNEKYGNIPKTIPSIEELCEEKKNYKFAVPKKIGFDFVSLGYKTKWTETDYRFEWSPLISFVFFKWQIAVTVIPEEQYHYWEAWLYYENDTDKTKSQIDRIEQCKEEFPLIYTTSNGEEKKTINYYDVILKDKYK
jgi:hypothetical protein